MTATITLAFLHHAAAFVVVGALMTELVLLRNDLTVASAHSVLRMDAAYGVAATVLLVVGLLRVFYTEKGAAYYFASGSFLTKLTLFVIVGLISIHPTMTFIGWRGALREQRVPVLNAGLRRKLRLSIHVELTLLFVIMLMAVMMARGIWYVG
jgi:putative membrane protein